MPNYQCCTAFLIDIIIDSKFVLVIPLHIISYFCHQQCTFSQVNKRTNTTRENIIQVLRYDRNSEPVNNVVLFLISNCNLTNCPFDKIKCLYFIYIIVIAHNRATRAHRVWNAISALKNISKWKFLMDYN